MPWTVIQPHHNEAGVLIDPCFWCGRIRCQFTHDLEMAEHRTALHVNALESLWEHLTLLRQPRAKRPVAFVPQARPRIHFDSFDEEIAALMLLRPENMGIEEQRLKAHFREFSKSMSREDAWNAAKRQTRKEGLQNSPVYPRFTSEERRNIKRWKPRPPQ